MSRNAHDHESPYLHFWRALVRRYKIFKKMPISLEDISVVQMSRPDGTAYEARRDRVGGWAVYRIYGSAYGRHVRAVHEALGTGLSLEAALDMLGQRCPEGIGRNEERYNHPRQVARLIGYTLATPG
jgi:hypothetical protein